MILYYIRLFVTLRIISFYYYYWQFSTYFQFTFLYSIKRFFSFRLFELFVYEIEHLIFNFVFFPHCNSIQFLTKKNSHKKIENGHSDD